MKRFLIALLAGARLAAADGSTAVGDPVLEPATTTCLAVRWIVGGDDDGDARVALAWRAKGAADWRDGADLWRVGKGHHVASQAAGGGATLPVPEDARLFAGSVLWLQPGTDYELRVQLIDADGGGAERIIPARTTIEPIAAADARLRYVAPGDGGGSGEDHDPWKGLPAALARVKPGDVLLLQKGVYPPVEIAISGEPGKPIILRGLTGAVIDGAGAGRVISATGIHDVWFEDLELRNGEYGIVAHESTRLVVRGCHLHGVAYGVTATRDRQTDGFFIADNLLEGPSTWPRTKGIEGARGIQISGEGHEVCYNRVRGFADAINTFQDGRCSAIDFHHNDVSELTDDGIELDFSQRNVRCFQNRLTNVYQGISLQPIFGGPVYVLRNLLVNVPVEPFKLHNGPSGAIIMHNTVIKKGSPFGVYGEVAIRRCVSRNNLFIGFGEDRYATSFDMAMEDCDFDYDGFGGGPWGNFCKWNKVKYPTLEAMREAPIHHHSLVVDPKTTFAAPLAAVTDENAQRAIGDDVALAADATAIDAGLALPGINDGFAGKAPDLGAYEFSVAAPHYGPRPKK
ncbi:MAG TPA: right-handed parallel beta-helix repeat-containing protein [Planctomycetota bacterium]|nr:right-handed parallel beta-helix repeat-containing protein [Planctomycetota bacterium]